MVNRLNRETVETLVRMDIPVGSEIESTNKEIAAQNNYEKAQMSSQSNSNSTAIPQFEGSQGYEQAMMNSHQQREKQQPVVAEAKTGRNEPCPCGSGKKYKQCHGK